MRKLTIPILLMAASLASAQLEVIRTLTPEQGQEVRYPVEARIFNAPQKELPALEQELLAIFKSPDTTLEGKQYACRMLRFCASATAVPVLEKELLNPELSMFVRFVLQGVGSDKVDAALMAALPDASDNIKIGIVSTLGQRGSAGAVKAIAPYLESGNADLRRAAVTALGNIGGRKAVKALSAVDITPGVEREWKQAMLHAASGLGSGFLGLSAATSEKEIAHTLLNDADQDVRSTALVCLVHISAEASADLVMDQVEAGSGNLQQTAIGLLDRVPTGQLMDHLMQLKPEMQVRVLGILADRKATDAETAVHALAMSENAAVRNAAYVALSQLGGVHSVGLLIARAPQDKTAFEALCAMQAEHTDLALIEQFKLADDDRIKSRLLDCLSLRQVSAALPLFIEQARQEWSRSCKSAIDGMATLVSEKDFSVYADLLRESGDKRKTEAIEQSIGTAAQRLPDSDACARPLIRAVDQAAGETKYALIRALGRIGGDHAKQLLIKAAKSDDAQVQDAAVRGLANWPSVDAAPDLLEIAVTSANETHRVLALRGYIRLAGCLSDYNKALEMCYKAANATARPAELKSIISCVKKFREPQVLDFLMLQLDNDGVYDEAATAILGLVNHWKVKPHSNPALEKIIEIGKNEALADKAGAILKARE